MGILNEKVAVLLPCYNEELTIGKVIDDFKKELPNAIFMCTTIILKIKPLK